MHLKSLLIMVVLAVISWIDYSDASKCGIAFAANEHVLINSKKALIYYV